MYLKSKIPTEHELRERNTFGNVQRGFKMKRQRIEIMAQILAFCKHAKRKTRIMYKNNLSYAQLKDYLTFLTSLHLLARDSDTYLTTEKGYRFLEAFTQLANTYRSGFDGMAELHFSPHLRYDVCPKSSL
jgi:predicted transcriptional regulator